VTVARRIRAIALGIAAFLLASGVPLPAGASLDVQQMVVEEAMQSRVPPSLALAVARVESNFQPMAQSSAGARGVMQIMPKTARDVFGVGQEQLWNARLNIRLGIAFLEQLYDQYGQRWDLALSHYNGGTLAGGAGRAATPHTYTRKYVADVLHWQRVYMGRGEHGGRIARERSYRTARAEDRIVQPRPSGEKPRRIDPLEFGDWAEAEGRRLFGRRSLRGVGPS
jgi:hypothetical protein